MKVDDRRRVCVDGAQDVVAFSATPDASKITATLSTQTTIGDIAVLDVARALQPGDVARRLQPSVTQITHVNDDLFTDIQQSEPEEIWYKTFDGKTFRAGF